MEYIEQVERIYKYFEYNLDFNFMRSMIEMKHEFNNDLNLIGCFFKDYLIVKNPSKVPDDDKVADEFILYFEDETSKFPCEYSINEIRKYAKYYLSIVFEDFNDENILITVSTVNSCFAMQYYPVIMRLLNKHYNQNLIGRRFKLMLDSLVDIAIDNFESSDDEDMKVDEIEAKIRKLTVEKSLSAERTLV